MAQVIEALLAGELQPRRDEPRRRGAGEKRPTKMCDEPREAVLCQLLEGSVNGCGEASMMMQRGRNARVAP